MPQRLALRSATKMQGNGLQPGTPFVQGGGVVVPPGGVFVQMGGLFVQRRVGLNLNN